MEPMHVGALLHLKVAEEERRRQLEHYFVARDIARSMRRERIRSLRRRFPRRGTAAATVELAA